MDFLENLPDDRLCRNIRCKEKFIPRRRDQVYCSKFCNNNRNHKYYRKTFGISEEVAHELRGMQTECDICGTTKPGGSKNMWCIDHKHGTKDIRGLLCNNCNAAIGFAMDSPDILRKAAEYLERYEAKVFREGEK